MDENKITLINDDGTQEEFYVIEETRFADENYLLISDSPADAEEADAYILREIPQENEEEALYEFVEDETLLDALGDIFAELLGDDADIV